MPIQKLIICCTPCHPQQTSATPQRAPEFIFRTMYRHKDRFHFDAIKK